MDNVRGGKDNPRLYLFILVQMLFGMHYVCKFGINTPLINQIDGELRMNTNKRCYSIAELLILLFKRDSK